MKKPANKEFTFDDIIPINNMFNKDESGLNPLHYAYLYDLPQVRQILRQSGLSSDSAEKYQLSKTRNRVIPNESGREGGLGRKRMTITNFAPETQMNLRGQVPEDLRHLQKPEDSEDETDEEERKNEILNADDEMNFEITEPNFLKLYEVERERDKQLQERRKDAANYDKDDPKDVLMTTPHLGKKEKLAFYEDPDYVFIVDKKRMNIIRQSLENLCSSGGVFYTTYDRDDNPE